jgi:hypothetical protein
VRFVDQTHPARYYSLLAQAMLFALANYCLPQQINPDLIACSNQQIPSLWSHLASSAARPDEHHLRVVTDERCTPPARSARSSFTAATTQSPRSSTASFFTQPRKKPQKVVGDSDAVDDEELEDYGITRHITSPADIESWKLVSLLDSTIFT